MTAAAPTALGRPTLAPWIAREALAFTVPILLAALVVAALPATLGQDGWLALVAGREIAASGLPGAEQLTLAAQGAAWVDQQWLAQLALYGVVAGAGVAAVLAVNAALVVGSFAAACVGARRLGGSPTAVGLVAAACALTAPWSWQLRPQTLAYPLFVALLWLLASDARSASGRVLLVLPLLALWANVHGSVVLGAALVLVHALMRRRPVLAAAAPLAVFASPYGPELAGYYRRMLLDSELGRHVTEWQSPFSSLAFAPALVLIVFVVAVLVRVRRRLPISDAVVLLALVAAAAFAARNAVWLQLGAVLLLPAGLRLGAGRVPQAVRTALAGAALVLLAGAVALASGRPVEREWPSAASAAVAGAVGADPGLRVLADDRHADWLLWSVPATAGRLAYDVRFELYGPRELERYARFLRAEPGWQEVAGEYGLVVVGTERKALLRALGADERFAVLHRDEHLAVLRRTA